MKHICLVKDTIREDKPQGEKTLAKSVSNKKDFYPEYLKLSKFNKKKTSNSVKIMGKKIEWYFIKEYGT